LLPDEKTENPAAALYRAFVDAWQLFAEALHPQFVQRSLRELSPKFPLGGGQYFDLGRANGCLKLERIDEGQCPGESQFQSPITPQPLRVIKIPSPLEEGAEWAKKLEKCLLEFIRTTQFASELNINELSEDLIKVCESWRQMKERSALFGAKWKGVS
jgi:hypothetical protein